MNTHATGKKNKPIWTRRAVFILWLAMLSYGLPEVIAGTGSMWIVTPGVYIFAGPLYVLHFLVLVQIALLTGRTSWPALYLFGVLFGLYETWITKVVWAGYPGENGFSFGSFGPYFGAHETVGLILFYHAVISFLLPLAVLSRLFPTWGAAFPVPDWVFGTGRWALARRLGLLLILGTVSGHNNPAPANYLLTWLPFLAVLILGYLILRRADPPRITSPRLDKPGFAIALTWLAVIYVVGFNTFRPEDTPPADALLATVVLYLFTVGLIWRTARITPFEHISEPTPAKRPLLWLLAVFGFGVVVIVVPNLSGILAIPAFLGMVGTGAVLLAWLGLWRAITQRR